MRARPPWWLLAALVLAFGCWTVYLADDLAGAHHGLVDVTAPSVPANLSANARGTTGADLSWDPSTDNASDPADLVYVVYRDGTQIHTTAAGVTTFSDTDLTPATEYGYRVRARDQHSNVSAQTDESTVFTDRMPLASETLTAEDAWSFFLVVGLACGCIVARSLAGQRL